MAFYTTDSTKIGTKGSDVYTANGVDDPRVALSVLLVQGCDPITIRSGMDTIINHSSGDRKMLEDLFVLLFQTRDIRGGKGIRDTSMLMIKHLLYHPIYSHLMLDLLDLIPEYGSWRDLKVLGIEAISGKTDESKRVANRVLFLFKERLLEDERMYAEREKGLSLAAKYAPRECHKNVGEKILAKYLAAMLTPIEMDLSRRLRNYRMRVSSLNQALDTTEVKMCYPLFADIHPEKVPGRALQKYMKAFLNEGLTSSRAIRHPDDSDRIQCAINFKEHFAKAAKGEAKINGSKTVFPHELIKKVVRSSRYTQSSYSDEDDMMGPSMSQEEKDAIVGVWNQMVKDAKEGGGLGRSLAMCDFSGSMRSSGTNKDTPYWVSMALGLLISEVTTKEFEDVFLTFDSYPTFHQLPKGDIFQRVASIGGHLSQGVSTDFQKAMDLVLQRCKMMRVKPGQEPENLIVLTDMNWDEACGSDKFSYYTGNRYRHNVKTEGWQTHVEMIRESFKRAGEDMWGCEADGGLGGLKMPRIVIWNIAATSTDFHAKTDTEGVVMLAGWSPSLFKVLQKEGVVLQTPYAALRCQLDDERYDLVRERFRAWEEDRFYSKKMESAVKSGDNWNFVIQTKATLPPGTYYIGDLYCALDNTLYEKVFKDNGLYKKVGDPSKVFLTGDTQGVGEFKGRDGYRYLVDYGALGIASEGTLDPKKAPYDGGKLYTFKSPVTVNVGDSYFTFCGNHSSDPQIEINITEFDYEDYEDSE